MNDALTYSDVALAAWRRHITCHSLAHYAGIVSLHGLARLAKIMNSDDILAELKRHIRPFWEGTIPKAVGVYGETVYRWGGNATAYLVNEQMTPEAYDVLIKSADLLFTTQSRDSRGIFHVPNGNRIDGSEGFIWIDTVFAVCPFLMWAGLSAKRSEWVDDSCFQMIQHHEILFDQTCSLYHQAIHFNLPGELSPAHWGRGCGWGAYALAEMVCDLPESHREYERILDIYRTSMTGCRNHMDENGMLHQTAEDHSTYVESSGTALVLYAIGRGLQKGILEPSEFEEPFLRGLQGMTRYIALDGSVFHCCPGCLAPGEGTVQDYENKQWILNDDHAFGPVILLFGTAEELQRSNRIPRLGMLLKQRKNP